MQLEALEDHITLEKIYYSRFAGDPDHEKAVIIDLTYVRTLIEWYDAFETAQRTGNLRGLRLLLEEKRAEFFTDPSATDSDWEKFSNFVGTFGAAQRELDAGFSLETGIKTERALKSLSQLDSETLISPEGIALEPLEILMHGFETDQSALLNPQTA